MTGLDRVHVIAAAELSGEERRRHEGFMERAVRQARRNPDRPFGAVIVERATGRLLAEAVNAVHESPILHGETGAIDACARRHPRVSWPEVTLYTTAEPCPMCAAAIAWTGIGEVVIGTGIETLSGLGISQIHIACATVLRAAPLYQGRLIVGILAGPNRGALRRLGGPASARSPMRTPLGRTKISAGWAQPNSSSAIGVARRCRWRWCERPVEVDRETTLALAPEADRDSSTHRAAAR